ncbi:MAG: LPXTG cell wall anchor domain-containing protein [Streptococcaceae bacterium]|nr:LPXTG cell wall anchor domain-containing protein [Streptococcaceae bacterium]
MAKNKRFKSSFLLLPVLFLTLFTTPQEKAKAAVTEDEVEFVGFLGPRHILSASDFRIPLAKVKSMDLVSQSNAVVHDVLAQEKSTDGIHVRKNDVEESPGVYDVEFGLDQDENVKKKIEVTVYDDIESPEGSESAPIPSESSEHAPTPGPISYQPGDSSQDFPAATGTDSSGKRLPLTGEQISSIVVTAGILALFAAGLVLILRKKPKKNNNF